MKNKTYHSPGNHPIFIKTWKTLLPEIQKRENFKEGHLRQLEVLCDLYVEYHKLRDIIDVAGYTMDTEGGRNGPQSKPMVELRQLNKTRELILAYSKQLGLVLYKDTETTPNDGDKNDWD